MIHIILDRMYREKINKLKNANNFLIHNDFTNTAQLTRNFPSMPNTFFDFAG